MAIKGLKNLKPPNVDKIVDHYLLKIEERKGSSLTAASHRAAVFEG